jgi:ABC-type branched-subunit amino acid transport system ATPase component
VLLIEHHLGLVGDVAHRVTVLANGRTLAEGTLDQVKERPDVQAAFLGKARQ